MENCILKVILIGWEARLCNTKKKFTFHNVHDKIKTSHSNFNSFKSTRILWRRYQFQIIIETSLYESVTVASFNISLPET